MVLTVFESCFARVGARHEVTWPELVTALSTADVVPTKDRARVWAPAAFAGNRRRKAHVIELSALVLDYDAGTSPAEAVQAWGQYTGCLHTSFSHTPQVPRFRLVIPYSEPIKPWRHDHAFAWAQTVLASDPACKDPSRIFFEPVVSPGGVFDFQEWTGRLLDPADIPAPPKQPIAVLPKTPLPLALHKREEAMSPEYRRQWALARGGTIVDTRAKGMTCPGCGRPSLWLYLGNDAYGASAYCDHKNTCGHRVRIY